MNFINPYEIFAANYTSNQPDNKQEIDDYDKRRKTQKKEEEQYCELRINDNTAQNTLNTVAYLTALGII